MSGTSTIHSCVIQHHNTLCEAPNLPRGFSEAMFPRWRRTPRR
jgi:hypothetical protein